MAAADKRLVGFSDSRCDDPRGQTYNWRTKRAMVVAADGTGTREVGRSLIDQPDVWTQFAEWSPDGRIAVVHRTWESDENFAWERANKQFRMKGGTGEPGSGGWLLDSCLVDLATGKTENVTAVERVSDYNTGLFFWPGDPNSLGFTALINSVSHPFRMDRDGRNKRDLTTGTAGFTYGYSASPDGKRVTYHKNYQIYVGDSEGKDAVHVNTGSPFQFAPVWSPDGQWLLFVDGEHYDCHPTVVRADGTGARRLASRGGYRGVTETLDVPDFHSESSDVPVWSADSKWIYFTAAVDGANELMRVSLDGEEQRVTRSKPGVSHYHMSMSPDGEWIVFGSTRDGARALYVAKPDGSEVHPVTKPTPGRSQMHPHWSPEK